MFDFNETIPRRGTNCIKWDSVPDGVIPMSIADADWATPRAVADAVAERLGGHPVFGYGREDGALHDTVIAWFKRKYGVAVEKSWLLTIQGIVPALVQLSRLAEGDVLAGSPNYVMLLGAPPKAGKRMITSSLRERRGGNELIYEYDFDDLERRAGEGADILYLCNPHNPIGKVYSRAELKELADFAAAKNLITVSDEIHCELIYGAEHTPWVSVSPENSVTLIAAGKICNMPGIPIAIAVVPDEKLRNKVRSLLGMGGPGALNIAACRGAFSEECDVWKGELNAYLRASRDYLGEEIPRRFPKARFPSNDGTYLQWIDLTEYGLPDAQKHIFDRARVALTGGEGFGGTKSCVRLNFATSRAVLTEALDRIEEALK
ncbi:MAG: aminotransferase class I/II-fold pyridoxal phosphate-dependent enzyme [Oscillospiraceae bacterium]|jgi:cystathionine beta-lyase|nr:aminotransferase class I/II-fold pyridoxal phosphate-dependent enzyme [Oscillospiraceae bacterium]